MLLLAIGDIHIPHRAVDFPPDLLLPGKIQQVLCLGNVTSSPSTLNFLSSLSSDFQIVKGAFDLDAKLPLSSVVQHGPLKIGFLNGYTIVPRNDPLSLLTEARKMDVDILISGGTHRVEAYTLDSKLFINPGSATGAFAPGIVEGDDEGDSETEEGEEGNSNSAVQSSGTGLHAETEQKNDQHDVEKTAAADPSGSKVDSLYSLDDTEEDMVDPIPSFCLLDVQGPVCTLYIYTYLDDEVKVDKVTYRKE